MTNYNSRCVELLILGILRSPPKDADSSIMVCYWRVFSVELGTFRLMTPIAIYCVPFDVAGDNIITAMSAFPTKSHEMRGRMIGMKLHDGVDDACN